jgi:hypothetical protein
MLRKLEKLLEEWHFSMVINCVNQRNVYEMVERLKGNRISNVDGPLCWRSMSTRDNQNINTSETALEISVQRKGAVRELLKAR